MTRKMKDSGIEWIGEITEDWEVVKLKHLALDRQAGVWGKDESQDNLTNNKICIRIADFDYPRMTIRKDKEFTLRNYTDNEISKCSLQKGDILIEKSGGGEKTPVGRTIIWNEDFQALYANFIERLRVDKKQILPMFAQFCFFAFYGIGGSNLYLNQTTGIQNLNITGMMNDLRLPTPDLSTQIKIVDILDRKRNQIESIKSAIIKEIQTLEDYKKSIITEAVTKGLDKNVEMKDSGIEWIGEIPKHWEIVKGKYIFKQRNTRGNYDNLVLLSPSQKYGVVPQKLYEKLSGMNTVKLNQKTDFTKLKTIKAGDFCISLRSFQGGFEYSNFSGVVSPAYQVFYSFKESCDEYFKYLFKEKGFINKMNSYTMSLRDGKNISFNDFGNSYIPYPPIKEQKLISNYLEKITKLIDDSIAIKQKQLETLEEYKKSLIYEYVTGKKEVNDGEET